MRVSILAGAVLFLSVNSYGDAIHLDKKYYSWTQKVKIAVVAPLSNRHPGLRDVIGDGKNGFITVKTGQSRLENYQLVETGENSGIFMGTVQLTGFKDDVDGDGISDVFAQTGGKGPTDGQIAVADRSDSVTVTWTPGTGDGGGKPVCNEQNYGPAKPWLGWDPAAAAFAKGQCVKEDDKAKEKANRKPAVTETAQVRWNTARMGFDTTLYHVGGTARIRVLDADMDFSPARKDRIDLIVKSGSNVTGIKTLATETGNDTGLFEASIILADKESAPGSDLFGSQDAVQSNRLRVVPQDWIKAEYVDRTLPEPFGKKASQDITVNARISNYTVPTHTVADPTQGGAAQGRIIVQSGGQITYIAQCPAGTVAVPFAWELPTDRTCAPVK